MPDSAPPMRAQLAQSAFELFSKRGFRDVNLDQIAAEAGVTKGSLYWHYRSKKELVVAACNHYYRTWQQRAYEQIAIDDDPLGQLERVIGMSVDRCLFDHENRVFTTSLFALSLTDDELRYGWSQFYDTVRELLVGLLRAACVRGKIDVADPRQAVDWMLATIEGIKQRATFEPEICTAEHREALVAGLMRIACGASAQMPGSPVPAASAGEPRYTD